MIYLEVAFLISIILLCLQTKGNTLSINFLLVIVAFMVFHGLRNINDRNADPLIFFYQYTFENFSLESTVGRHLLVLMYVEAAKFMASFSGFLVPASSIFLILSSSLPIFISSVSVYLSTKASNWRLVTLLFMIPALTVPSVILLSSNFLSQFISASLMVSAFVVFESNSIGKGRFPASIMLAILALSNHFTSVFVLCIYAIARLSVWISSLFRQRLFIGILALTLIGAILLVSTVYFSSIFGVYEGYMSEWEDTSLFRLMVRVIYPYILIIVLVKPSAIYFFFSSISQSSIAISSILGSLVCIALYSFGVTAMPWRMEYYFSYMMTFYMVIFFSKFPGKIQKFNFVSFVSLIIIALPLYGYKSISRLFLPSL